VGDGDAGVDDLADEVEAAGLGQVDDLVAAGAAGEAVFAVLAATLDEDRLGAADEGGQVGSQQGLAGLEDAGEAAAFFGLGDVVGELEGGGVGALAVLEAKDPQKADLADEVDGGQGLVVGLAGEAHDHVGRQGETGAGQPQGAHAVDVLGAGVAADHPLEDPVAAGLHGHVHVLGEDFEVAVGGDEGGGEVARVRAGVAQAPQGGDLGDDAAEQGCELALVGVIGRGLGGAGQLFFGVVVAVDGLAEQGDLGGAGVGDAANFFDDLVAGAVALRAPGVGDDAERAALVAALHDGDVGRGGGAAAAGGLGLEKARRVEVEDGADHGEPAGVDLGQQRGQLGDVVGAQHHVDAGHALADTLALLLGHAAGDHQQGVGALALEGGQAADLAAQLLLGLLAHAARVEDDDVGLVGRACLGVPRASQHLVHALGVVGVHLAAKGVDRVRRHREAGQ